MNPGGPGVWDNTTHNWYNGSSDVAWNNATNAIAVFDGSPGTVNIVAGITASGFWQLNSIPATALPVAH